MKPILQLGRYLLVDKIASGGMADVYRATLLGVAGFEKNVAIKKILPHWSGNREFVDMLIDEARVLLHLNHANIVQVFELNQQDDIYYLVMEYVDGVDLRQFSRRLTEQEKKLPYSLIAFIVRQVGNGLAYAHERKDRNSASLGIVHRDISPQNILISFDGDVKLTDFGIAKAMGKTNETAVGTLKGKFAYMSPEQAVGGKIDARTDIFALGILLFEMATGERCFKGNTDFETLEAVRQARVAIPSDQSGLIPKSLQAIILKALQKDPERRYQSVMELNIDLKKLELELGEEASSTDLKDFLSKVFREKLEKKAEADEELNKQTQIFLKSVSKKTIAHSYHTRILVGDTKLLEGVEAIPTMVDLSPFSRRFFGLSKRSLVSTSLVLVMGFIGLGWHYLSRSGKEITTVKPALPEPASPEVARPQPAMALPEAALPEPALPEPASPEVARPQPALPEPAFPEPTPVPAPVAMVSPQPSVPQPSVTKSLTGALQVSSRPWAKVSIAGIVNGAETPFARKNVPVGHYDLKVTSPQLGKTVTTKLTIRGNSLVTCQAQFGENPRVVCR